MFKIGLLNKRRRESMNKQGSMGLGEKLKSSATKYLVIRINLVVLAAFIIIFVGLLHQPPMWYHQDVTSPAVQCSSRKCLSEKTTQVEALMVKKAIREKRVAPREDVPAIFKRLQGEMNIGLVNVGDDGPLDWQSIGNTTAVEFERVSEDFEWKDLFPVWINEEEENGGTSCPEIPMPDLSLYEEVDVVVARLPCRRPEKGWSRDVFRLQVHLIVANMAARKGKRDANRKVKVVLESECRPMAEIFRCDDMVAREGRWWMFEVEGVRLEEKVALPVGSCKLALPLEALVVSKITNLPTPPRREAYATVLHSSDKYVCGAIALAQSIIKTGSTRDLILLHDASIPRPKLDALVSAGWKLHLINRVRNPHAKKNSYNEYNYSKFRLWQLTYYQKVIFIDSDIIVLRNLDLLFKLPQISAVGNNGVIFNSGVMVIEPSECTFDTMMESRNDIMSYNGGDQGYLNEMFVWWHRLPRRVNFLKHFWSNKTAERVRKNALFGSDPPKLYGIHYLGRKPWQCYRQYDCNWNIEGNKVYASDVAHKTWWKLHDQMDENLKGFCVLSEERKEQLENERQKAEKLGLGDGHWRIKIE